jgi:hypothetical protein
MFVQIAAERRLLGFDTGDWSILVAGIALMCCLLVLV